MIQTFTTVLTSKQQLTFDVWIFKFKLIDPLLIEFIAGQYLILQIEDRGLRNYSILSPNYQKDGFNLLIQMVTNGLASTYLSALKTDDQVIFKGPAGKFILKDNHRDVIFLATGTGVAPIKSMIETTLHNANVASTNTKYYLFWGLRNRNDIYFVDEFAKLSKEHPNFRFKICLSGAETLAALDSAWFARGRINPILLQFLGVQTEEQARMHCLLLNQFDYYICGGRDVVESVRQFVLNLGVNKEQIYFEKF